MESEQNERKRPITYWIGEGGGWLLRHVVSGLAATGITPNMFTFLGLAVNSWAAALFAMGKFRQAAAVLFLAGFPDMADGQVARRVGRVTAFGAFLDSTLDRYSEGAIYIGLAAYFVSAGGPLERWLVLGTLAALAGSFLVSYVRARAQSLGFSCETGLFARPERVVVTVVGLIFGGVVLYAVIFLLAALTNLTALQRIREVWLQGRAQRLAMEREAKAALNRSSTATP
jgi:CDP-diacylglycerol--glycerol-3-phosphate 3-phosphatidyltransferase